MFILIFSTRHIIHLILYSSIRVDFTSLDMKKKCTFFEIELNLEVDDSLSVPILMESLKQNFLFPFRLQARKMF